MKFFLGATTAAMVMTLTLLVGVDSAKAASYKVDPAHHGVVFNISHLKVSKIFGRFNELTGQVNYDPAKPEATTINLAVQAKSIDTANEQRDKHLRSPDFFNVAEFPVITFKSTRVVVDEKDKDKTELKVTGDLTLLGVTKSVTVEFDVRGPRDKGALGFVTELEIKRSDFGMKYGLPDAIGDKVELDISFELIKP